MFIALEVLQYENFDLENVVTPVRVDVFEKLLKESKYDPVKAARLVEGFKNGFSLGFQGERRVQRLAPNLKLREGNETILWNKVMKKVKEGRYAGPFESPPFKHFIQSPTRLFQRMAMIQD